MPSSQCGSNGDLTKPKEGLEEVMRLIQISLRTKDKNVGESAIRKMTEDVAALEPTSPCAPYGCPGQSHNSSAPLPTCPETCKDCKSQFLPGLWQLAPWMRSRYLVSDEEASATASMLVANTRGDLEHVRFQIEKYGDTILKRWQRRSAKQREGLLLQAMPDMYPHKWLLAFIVYEFQRNIKKQEQQEKHLLLLPYVELPTLSQEPVKLLALMQWRAHANPADWVMLDSYHISEAFNQHLGPSNNPHCVVMYGKNYGRLIKWNRDSAHRWDIIGYPRAKKILESQAALARFLRTMVDLILGTGLEHAAEGRDRWDALAQENFRQAEAMVSGPTYCLRPFSPPPIFNLGIAERLLQALLSRRNAIADQVWLLQTDPRYLRRYVAQFKDAVTHGLLPSDEMRHYQLAMQPHYHVAHIGFWDTVVADAKYLGDTCAKYKSEVRIGRALPAEYANAIARMRSQLKILLMTQIRELVALSFQLKAFQWCAKRKVDGIISFGEGLGRGEILRKDPVFWNLLDLEDITKHSEEQEWQQDTAFHIAFMNETIAQASGKDKARFDQIFLDYLSDLVATEEALNALNLHGPFQAADAQAKCADTRLENMLLYQNGLAMLRTKACREDVDQLWKPMEAFLKLPSESKKVSLETITQTEDLHHAQEAYWAAVRAVTFKALEQETGKDLTERDCGQMLYTISVNLTEEYREGVQEELNAMRQAVTDQGTQDHDRLTISANHCPRDMHHRPRARRSC